MKNKILFLSTVFTLAGISLFILATCKGPQYTIEATDSVATKTGVGISLGTGSTTNDEGIFAGYKADDVLMGGYDDNGFPNGFISIGRPAKHGELHIGYWDNDDAELAKFIPTLSVENSLIRINADDILLHPSTSSRGNGGRALVADASDQLHINYSGDFTGGTWVDGTLYASLASPSDSRLKTRVVDLQDPLDKVLRLHGVSYEWKQGDNLTDRAFPKGRQIGLIAQEVQAIVPEVVQTGGDSLLSISYDKLVPLLIEAVKEQNTSIENMRKEIESLKSRMAIQ